MKYKLAVLDSHLLQYRAPLFKKLAQHPKIDLCVYYCSDFGATERMDPGFGIKYKWDLSFLEGYHYKFLKNYSPNLSLGAFWGLINPGIFKELCRGRYDAIIIHGYASLTNLLAYLTAWIAKTPVMFCGEIVLHPSRRWWLKGIKHFYRNIIFRRTKAFLTIGSKNKQFYYDYGIPREKLFFTPYSVNNEYFINQVNRRRMNREEIKKDIGIPAGLPVILCVFKLIPRKKPQDVLKAFEKICTKAALVFIGDGKLRPFLEDYVCKNQIRNVFFLGFKNQSELPSYYAIADIFVLPSSDEPWGLVINEALCAALPIITTDKVAAAYDLVKEDRNGYIVKVGDIEGLTRLLEDLISDAKKTKDMGLKSQELISGWNYDICVEGIIEALEFVTRPVLPNLKG